MANVSLGDLAHSFMLRRQAVALKAESQRLSTELVTGLAADTGAKLHGDYATLSGIDTSLARLQAYKMASDEAAAMASGIQSVLTMIDGLAGDTASLMLGTTSGSTLAVDIAGRTALQNFEAATSALNTTFAGRGLLSGVRSESAAVVDTETILQSIESAGAAATSALDLEIAVANWFDDPTGYEATAYLGGDPRAALLVGPADKVPLTITARDPAIRDTLKGLALGALLARGALAGDTAERAELARRAGEALIQSQSGRTGLAADVGMAEARIEAASARNAAETTALQIARVDLLGVDGYETATRLEATETQLETIYSVTERIARLSLTDYL